MYFRTKNRGETEIAEVISEAVLKFMVRNVTSGQIEFFPRNGRAIDNKKTQIQEKIRKKHIQIEGFKNYSYTQ